MKEIRWYLETALFLSISWAVSRIPHRYAMGFGRGLGRFFYRILKRRREIAIDNIEKALPYLERQPGWAGGTPEEIARETFENLGRSVVENCRIYHGRGRDLIDAVQFRGIEHYHEAMKKGKGVVFITAHSGNWELFALAFGTRYHEASVVARRQDNRHLNAVLERIRKTYGNGIIYKEGAIRGMFSLFKKQGVVGLLIDQAVTPDEGVLIEFLGRPAWAGRIAVLIGRKAGTPMLPAFIHREGDTHIITISPEYRPSENPDPEQAAYEDVSGLHGFIARYVVEHPSQWYWIHKKWKRAPERMPQTQGREAASE
ncbi:lysophospholipid acyltransferase family protein [Geomonas sp. Red32]|uniref:lysophospholipid acyltransferase family protein n=1 Tax=Geomonas sp. Red32 TaxID=2912856 RepID=UPI00202CA89F|nr:lysophospholipid acyltransferase family protein [Geomonas sp. Red32]